MVPPPRGEYGRVILPLTVLRRLDRVLEPTKAEVPETLRNREPLLQQVADQPFVNMSSLRFLWRLMRFDAHRASAWHGREPSRQGRRDRLFRVARVTASWFLTANRLGVDIAKTLVTAIRAGRARVDVVTLADLEIAAHIHDAFADQQFSIVDRTSWSIMQRLGVHEAISFDWDYSISRFGRNRRQAFTVHA